jgi:uncharacterized membrane protein
MFSQMEAIMRDIAKILIIIMLLPLLGVCAVFNSRLIRLAIIVILLLFAQILLYCFGVNSIYNGNIETGLFVVTTNAVLLQTNINTLVLIIKELRKKN